MVECQRDVAMKTRILVAKEQGDPLEKMELQDPLPEYGSVILQVSDVNALTDRSTIERLLGSAEAIHRTQLSTNGYSGSIHEKVEVQLRSGRRVSLVVKQVNLAMDWTAYRTGDEGGRECLLLAEPALDGLWEKVFHCPYLAFSVQGSEVALLMEDLTPHLLPDEDAPISADVEDALLGCLAKMHASYWESQVLDLPWLTPPEARFRVMGPQAASEAGWRLPTPPVFDLIQRGWRTAEERLSSKEMQILRQPAGGMAEACSSLPWTLLHGDAKMAHFALMPGGHVAALDWELIGVGPATLDVGWYLAVNSQRLARPKEDVMTRYRELLEGELGARVSDSVWERMVFAGLLCGAVMLLWAKALALEDGQPGAAKEWDWWAKFLTKLV